MKKMSNAVVLNFATALTVFSASFVSAHAAGAAGVGDLSCATYVKLYDGYDTDQRKLLDQKVEQWAFGYMSGLNERAEAAAMRDLSYLSDIGYTVLSECRASANLRIVDVVAQMYEYAPMAEPGSV